MAVAILNEPAYYTPEEMAERLKVSTRFIYDQIRKGALKGRKYGKCVRITRADAIDYDPTLKGDAR